MDDGIEGNLSVLVEDKHGRRFVAIVKEWVPLDAKDVGAKCEPSRLLEVIKHDGMHLFGIAYRHMPDPAPVLGRGDYPADRNPMAGGEPEARKEQCGWCKFWSDGWESENEEARRENAFGKRDCRRHAPQKTEGKSYDGTLKSVWPRTSHTDGCGDFEPWSAT